MAVAQHSNDDLASAVKADLVWCAAVSIHGWPHMATCQCLWVNIAQPEPRDTVVKSPVYSALTLSWEYSHSFILAIQWCWEGSPPASIKNITAPNLCELRLAIARSSNMADMAGSVTPSPFVTLSRVHMTRVVRRHRKLISHAHALLQLRGSKARSNSESIKGQSCPALEMSVSNYLLCARESDAK